MKKLLLACIACVVSPAAAQNYAPGAVTAIDCSKAIATANTAVTLLTAAQAAHGFAIWNVDTSEVLWVSLTGTATAATLGSFPLPPGTATTYAGVGSFQPAYGVGTGTAVTAVAATLGHKITCTYW